MPAEITMPQLSDTMTEGTLLKWNKREGDKVKAGETMGLVYCADDAKRIAAASRICESFELGDKAPVEPRKLIKEIINE